MWLKKEQYSFEHRPDLEEWLITKMLEVICVGFS